MKFETMLYRVIAFAILAYVGWLGFQGFVLYQHRIDEQIVREIFSR